MILGYRLRMLRKQNGMSQNDLGKLLGVSKVSVSGYEKGTRIPSLEIFLNILNVFEISADYILGRELDAVCESDDNIKVALASDDINIVKELREFPSLYAMAAENPKRFFSAFSKKNI